MPNILNTISKLDAFAWNDPPAPAGPSVRPGQQRQANGGQQHQEGQQQADEQQRLQQQQQLAAVLCPICLAPLADDELPGCRASDGNADASSGHTSGGSGTASAAGAAGCCLSCFQQILGGVDGSGSSVAAALPGDVRQQMAGLAAAGPQAAAGGPCSTEQLRQQIAEFLLE